MAEASVRTTQLHAWLDRLHAGDRAAADALLRATAGRLERLARRMLRGFPNVRPWADTDDVLQGALLRLLRTLDALRPAATRDFVNLAAVHIRRELLDLARHFGGACGVGANHASGSLAGVPAPADDSGELDRWAAFHAAVEQLPAAEREVVGLASSTW
jgi:RNA polymerase sigma-70 factor (ECF subfamily)